MKTRRSFLSALSAVPFLGLTTGCPGQTPAMVISEVEAGITDAEIAIQTIVAGVNAYFALHPNPDLQAKIANVVADTQSALRVVTSALAGASSIADGNVQTALQAFGQAYAALMALIAQINIQTAPSGIAQGARASNGTLYIVPPRLLKAIKVVAVPAAPVAPAPVVK